MLKRGGEVWLIKPREIQVNFIITKRNRTEIHDLNEKFVGGEILHLIIFSDIFTHFTFILLADHFANHLFCF